MHTTDERASRVRQKKVETEISVSNLTSSLPRDLITYFTCDIEDFKVYVRAQ